MKTRTASSLLAACAVATASFADLTLNVTGTMSFQDAVEAAGSSVAALNGGESKTESIVKTGDGTLTLDVNDLNLSAWEGDFGISNGTVRVTVSADTTVTAGILGSASAGTVTVANGATLEIFSEKIANDWSYVQRVGPKRPVHISGTGVDGKGALRLELAPKAQGGSARAVLPNKLFLDDDATIGWINAFQLVKDSTPVIDLGGHVLTFSAAYATGSGTIAYVDSVGYGNLGHLVFDGVTFTSRKTSAWSGDSSNTLTCRNGAMIMWDSGLSIGGKWTTEIGEGGTPASLYNNIKGDYLAYTDHANWYGPMTVSSCVGLYYAHGNGDTDRANKIQCTSLLGKVGGTGGFAADGSSAVYNIGRWKTVALNLCGEGNDFTGPLALKGMTLGLYSTTALPPGNDNIVLTNCQVAVNPPIVGESSVTRLENMRIVGTGQIGGNAALCGVVAEKLVKSGEGTLDVNLSMDAKRLEISGGTVKLLSQDAFADGDIAAFRRANAGLYHGTAAAVKPTSPTSFGYIDIDFAPYNVYYTNSIMRIPMECNLPNNSWNQYFGVSNSVYRTYSGYIWNDGQTAREWTFLVTYNGKWDLSVAGETVKNSPRNPKTGEQNPEPGICTFTLQPGANKFMFRTGNYYVSAGNYGHVCTNGLSNWTADRYAWGLAYDPQGRRSMDADDYMQFTEAEDVPLFTTIAPGDARFAYHIGTLAGTAAGTLDLCGQTVVADVVEGCVNVVNGTLLINATNAVASASQSFGPGRYMLSGIAMSRENNSGLAAGRSPGLYTIYNYNDFTNSAGYKLYGGGTATNSPGVFYSYPGEPYDGVNVGYAGWTELYWHYMVSYSGYIWNDGDAPRTLHCIATLNSYADFRLNGTLVGTMLSNWNHTDIVRDPTGNALANPVRFDMTLQPGANEFSIISYDRFGTTDSASTTWLHGNVCTNGLTGWDACHGFMYTELEGTRNDLSDYTAFIDPGDGSLFTTCLPPDEFESFASLTCVKGTTLDLGTSERTVVTLSGAPTVTNGLLAVTGTWTLTAEDIADADTVADGLSFSAGVVLDVAAASDLVALKPLYNSAPVTIARNFTGTIPAISQRLGNDGWRLIAENGELKLRYMPHGTMIIVR